MTLSGEKSNTEIINQRRMINGKDDGLMLHPLKTLYLWRFFISIQSIDSFRI